MDSRGPLIEIRAAGIAFAVLNLPVVEILPRNRVLCQNTHNRPAVDHARGSVRAHLPAGFHHLQKRLRAAPSEALLALSSRKRHRPAAVDPALIVRISAQFPVILIFKLSEITLGKSPDHMLFLPRIEKLRRLAAAL